MTKRQKLKALLWEKQKGRCAYCGTHMIPKGGSLLRSPTFDHVVPRSKGGKWKHNIVLACYSCNQRKGSTAGAPQVYCYRGG